MCIVYETLVAMVHFFKCAIIYILQYKCRYIYYTLFLCLQMKHEEVEHKKQVDQKNIRLNNQSKILPTSDEEMRHARSSSDDNSSSDE